MFDEKNHDRTDALSERMTRLGEQMNPSPRLMKAAATGTPLRSGIRYTAGTHVKQTVKAVLLYAACVALLLGAIMILPGLFSDQFPVAKQPTTRDTLTRTDLSEEEKEFYSVAWAVLKDTVPEDYTINDLIIDGIWRKYDEVYICSSYTWEQTKHLTEGRKGDPITISGCYFPDGSFFTVFADGEMYTMREALKWDHLQEWHVRAFYAVYRSAYLYKYESDYYPPNTSETPIDPNPPSPPQQYTELQIEAFQKIEAYEEAKYSRNYTIDDFLIWNVIKHRDIIICQYRFKAMAPVSTITYEPIAGYTFIYDYNSELYVFANQSRYILRDAYNEGVLSDDDMRIIWESHKALNLHEYELYENEIPTTPYVYDPSDPSMDLGKLLEDKTCVNDLIDQSSLHTDDQFKPKDPDKTGLAQLFDQIKTETDYTAAGMGQLSGSMRTFESFPYFLFDMKEKVQISAYVFTSGSECNVYTERHPISWHLFATNDANAAAEMRQASATYEETLLTNDQWVDLDYVWDGGAYAESFYAQGYTVDKNKQGEYQYYCWVIEYTGGNQLEVAELELYIN